MYNDYDDGDWTAGFRSRETWVRGFFMLLFLFAFWLVRILLTVTAVFQFGAQLIRGRPVARLLPFGRGIGLYLQQISDFLTFNTEERPFPFSPWPDPGETAADFMDDRGPEDDRPFEEYDKLYAPATGENEPDAETAAKPEPETDYGASNEEEGGEAADDTPDSDTPDSDTQANEPPPRPDA